MKLIEEVQKIVEREDWIERPDGVGTTHNAAVRRAALAIQNAVAAKAAELCEEYVYGNNADGSDAARAIRSHFQLPEKP